MRTSIDRNGRRSVAMVVNRCRQGPPGRTGASGGRRQSQGAARFIRPEGRVIEAAMTLLMDVPPRKFTTVRVDQSNGPLAEYSLHYSGAAGNRDAARHVPYSKQDRKAVARFRIEDMLTRAKYPP